MTVWSHFIRHIFIAQTSELHLKPREHFSVPVEAKWRASSWVTHVDGKFCNCLTYIQLEIISTILITCKTSKLPLEISVFHKYTGLSMIVRRVAEQTRAPPRMLVRYWSGLKQIAEIIKLDCSSTGSMRRPNKNVLTYEFHTRSGELKGGPRIAMLLLLCKIAMLGRAKNSYILFVWGLF